MVAPEHVREIQEWLRRTNLSGLVIPSTDEFLSEFAPPSERRLQWATGFRGSTGAAVVLQDAAALFLDGRYLHQAGAEIDAGAIVVMPATAASRAAWLAQKQRGPGRLAIDPWLHAAPDEAVWRQLARQVGLELVSLTHNPIDSLWLDGRPPRHKPPIDDYPVSYAGETHETKCRAVAAHLKTMGLHALLVADPEDVSWLLNVRAAAKSLQVAANEWQIVPSCTSRALIRADGHLTWFVDGSRLAPEVLVRGDEWVEVVAPESLPDLLGSTAKCGLIGADVSRTPVALSTIVEEHGKLCAEETVARRRWCKHPVEVEGARRAHIVDAAAVVRFMAWLARTAPSQSITEFQAAEQLQRFREDHPAYLGPSMPAMSASGLSGAQPHYVPHADRCRRLNDHPIYWMDSGGQYRGGTTDNTITFALAEPHGKHIRAHTLVLQGFIALAAARVPAGTAAFRLDALARQGLWREGMDYPHGTGHGVGNCLSIHEGPLITREPSQLSVVPLEPGMIVTNEPGYYSSGDFGIRIECHMALAPSPYKGFVEFNVISRLPIDPRLVDFGLLSQAERRWLATYHRKVLDDVGPLLDAESARWLRDFVRPFECEH